jgi:hypothetical protein
MQPNQPLPPTPPVLWILAGILWVGAIGSILDLVMNLIQTLLLWAKADIVVVRAGAILETLLTLGVEFLLVIWIIKNRQRLSRISTTWLGVAMVVWPLGYILNFILHSIQPHLLVYLFQNQELKALQRLKITLTFIQHGGYILLIMAGVGYLLLQKRPDS